MQFDLPNYEFGFHDKIKPVFSTKKGISEKIVKEISAYKKEPKWMLEFRLNALRLFFAKKMPEWGGDLSRINFDNIYYYVNPADKKSRSWEDVPAEIKNTFDKIGIPEAEKKFLAGVGAQYDSEVVYHSISKMLEKKGVIFTDTDTALKKYPELFKEYFGKVIPPADNKFAALNSAVWSGGSFIYIPKGVRVELPLQAYFRINAKNMGQFERTLIIADEGSYVHYVEGCTAPIYTTDSLHSAVVEILVKKGARVRYTTIQNWSKNVYNLVTKRMFVEEEGFGEWVDGNLGCVTGDTKLYTNPKGPVSISEVKVGDLIYSFDLNTLKPSKNKIIALKNNGVKKIYKLVTENFREIKVTSNHPFLTLQKNQHSNISNLLWKQLQDLKIGDTIGIINALLDDGVSKKITYSYSKERKIKNKVNIPTETTEDLMWLLGLYLGDGFMDRSKKGVPRRIYFAIPPTDKSRKKLIKTIDVLFKSDWKEKGISVTINSTVLAEFFISLGMSGLAKTKKIPQWVWDLPFNQKLAFVDGYFDADGYARKHTHIDGIEYGQIVFASSNKSLLEDLKLLMITCGLNPLKIATYTKERKLYKGIEKIYSSHYLSMNYRDNFKQIKEKTINLNKLNLVKIKSIEYIGEEEVFDIEVEGTHNFIANGILVHNSQLTMKYPSVYLRGRKARGEILSLAFAGKGQHQDAGGKAIHLAPETTSSITSKSVSKDGGRTSYRGLLKIVKGAKNSKSTVRCDALILDSKSRSDTYPTMDISEERVTVGHEASVSRIGEEQLFYFQSRGIPQPKAEVMIVNGFIEPIVKEIPMEFAVELNRLIQLEMTGSVG